MTPTERAEAVVTALDAYLVQREYPTARRRRLVEALVALASTDELARANDPTWPCGPIPGDPGTHGDAEFDRDTTPWREDEPR